MPYSFDDKKIDVEYLLIDAIQHKPHKDLEKLKQDLITFLKFKYPTKHFREEFESDKEHWKSRSETDEEFLKHYLQNIIDDFRDMFIKDLNVDEFTLDVEYLKQKDLLRKYSWQQDMKIEDVVKENLRYEMNTIIEEWYWELVDEVL